MVRLGMQNSSPLEYRFYNEIYIKNSIIPNGYKNLEQRKSLIPVDLCIYLFVSVVYLMDNLCINLPPRNLSTSYVLNYAQTFTNFNSLILFDIIYVINK